MGILCRDAGVATKGSSGTADGKAAEGSANASLAVSRVPLGVAQLGGSGKQGHPMFRIGSPVTVPRSFPHESPHQACWLTPKLNRMQLPQVSNYV